MRDAARASIGLRVLTLAAWAAASVAMPAVVARGQPSPPAAVGVDEAAAAPRFVSASTCASASVLDRALTLLFLAEPDEALTTFGRIRAAEPACALAWWGEAMSLARLPDFEASPAQLRQAGVALTRATTTAHDTRTRALIAAVHPLFDDGPAPGPLRLTLAADRLDVLARATPPDTLALGAAALVDMARSSIVGDASSRAVRERLRIAFPEPTPMPVALAFLDVLATDDADARAVRLASGFADGHAPSAAASQAAARVLFRAGDWNGVVRAASGAGRSPGGMTKQRTAIAWLGAPLEWFAAACAASGRDGCRRDVAAGCAPDDRGSRPDVASCRRADVHAWWAERDWQASESFEVSLAETDDRAPDVAVAARAMAHLALGLAASHDAWPRGEPDVIVRARRAIAALEAFGIDHPLERQRAELARWMVSMALAGAYESRDELRLYCDQALAVERTLEVVHAPGPPLVDVDRLAGELRLRLHDYHEAREHFRRVLDRQPGDARGLLGLARAAARLGDEAAARDAARRFLGVWAGAAERREAIEARRLAGR